MEDFEIMARILAAIRASEEMSVFDISLIDKSVLKTTAQKRDLLAVKLQKAGYIEGLIIIDDVDNQTIPYIEWSRSKPSVTIKGLEWMSKPGPLQDAIQGMKAVASATAATIVSNVIMKL